MVAVVVGVGVVVAVVVGVGASVVVAVVVGVGVVVAVVVGVGVGVVVAVVVGVVVGVGASVVVGMTESSPLSAELSEETLKEWEESYIRCDHPGCDGRKVSLLIQAIRRSQEKLKIAEGALKPFAKTAEWSSNVEESRACGIGCDMGGAGSPTINGHDFNCPIEGARSALAEIRAKGE